MGTHNRIGSQQVKNRLNLALDAQFDIGAKYWKYTMTLDNLVHLAVIN